MGWRERRARYDFHCVSYSGTFLCVAFVIVTVEGPSPGSLWLWIISYVRELISTLEATGIRGVTVDENTMSAVEEIESYVSVPNDI